MKQVNVQEAKAQFSRLLRRVSLGEEITITKWGVPVARLVPVRAGKRVRRKLGMDRGKFVVPGDFDAPPDEILDAFEGREKRT